MQFTLNHKIGQQKINVLFNALLFDTIKFKLPVIESFEISFERIGGEMQDDGTWDFPLFITSQIIQEIIHNTCFVCGGLMKNHTDYKYGSNRPIRMRKCTKCGHSHT